MMDNVNHPSNYCKPGRKECIDEMLDLFGVEAVRDFCLLNRYKYQHRYDLKNGDEDLQKANNYEKIYLDLGGNPEKLALKVG